MSKALQWVIGIGVVLVVAALVISSVASVFLPRAATAGMPMFSGPFDRMAPRLPFMGLFGLAGCLWPLVVAGLIVLAISLFSRRPAPPTFAPAQPAAPPVAPSPAACANCGQPLQPGWRHCPNCGTPVSSPAAGGVG